MADQNLPEAPRVPSNAAKPTVFHHDGRRLFLIDGEPRIVDVDIAEGLGYSRDRKVRELIARQLKGLAFFGPVLKFDPAGPSLFASDAKGAFQLPSSEAVDRGVLELLESEGVLDMSKRGEKPKVWFLNKDQMRWAVTKSETEQADEFLRELFRVYKAWEDGTLEPARPAVEPPRPPSVSAVMPALIAPSRLNALADFSHRDGVVFAEGPLGPLYVLGDSVAEALGLDASGFAAELAKWPQLALLGEMPSLEGRHGVWLLRAHLTFLLSRPGVATDRAWSIANLMAAHGDNRTWSHDGELRLRYPTAAVEGEYGRRDARGHSRVDGLHWIGIPAAFMRDRAGVLRIRHDRLADILGVAAPALAAEVLGLRRAIEDGVCAVIERHEVDLEKCTAVGLYLTRPHVVRLADLIGRDASRASDAFDRWEARDLDLMEALSADRRAFAEALPSAAVAASVDALVAEVAALRGEVSLLRTSPWSRLRRLMPSFVGSGPDRTPA